MDLSTSWLSKKAQQGLFRMIAKTVDKRLVGVGGGSEVDLIYCSERERDGKREEKLGSTLPLGYCHYLESRLQL